ncbi:MAG: hypothetical protein AAF761_09120 [Pseudomonadota bacterium]
MDLAFLTAPVSVYSVQNVPLPPLPLHWYKAAYMGAVDLAHIPVIPHSSQTRPDRELTNTLASRLRPKFHLFSSASLSASLRMIAAGIAVGPDPRGLARDTSGSGQGDGV